MSIKMSKRDTLEEAATNMYEAIEDNEAFSLCNEVIYDCCCLQTDESIAYELSSYNAEVRALYNWLLSVASVSCYGLGLRSITAMSIRAKKYVNDMKNNISVLFIWPKDNIE